MLVKINRNNSGIARRIMRSALVDNPNLRWMTRGNQQKLNHFYDFCLHLAMLQNGAYLNANKKGVVLFYQRGGQMSLINKIRRCLIYIKFVTLAIDASKFLKIYSLQQRIKENSPKKRHLYCIVIAVSPHQKSTETIIALRDFLFRQSRKRKLPIYIQTSVRRNKVLFERYGFQCYKTVENKCAKYTLWLLKRDYEKDYRRTSV